MFYKKRKFVPSNVHKGLINTTISQKQVRLFCLIYKSGAVRNLVVSIQIPCCVVWICSHFIIFACNTLKRSPGAATHPAMFCVDVKLHTHKERWVTCDLETDTASAWTQMISTLSSPTYFCYVANTNSFVVRLVCTKEINTMPMDQRCIARML